GFSNGPALPRFTMLALPCTSQVPRFSMVPPVPSLRSPVFVHTVLPFVRRTRASTRFLVPPPIAALVAEVRPTPLMLPPVQEKAPDTGRSPAQLRVPPDSASCPSPGEPTANDSVPPETCRPPRPARLCTAWVPVECTTSTPVASSGMHTSSPAPG